jgi:hypothetical protein
MDMKQLPHVLASYLSPAPALGVLARVVRTCSILTAFLLTMLAEVATLRAV